MGRKENVDMTRILVGGGANLTLQDEDVGLYFVLQGQKRHSNTPFRRILREI